jgi:hypothetical protein
VHPSAQVTEFRADVQVLDREGRALYPKERSVLIKRPDQYSDAERRRAENSVNVFGWEPARDQTRFVRAQVEPVQNDPEPLSFEGTRGVNYWQHAPTLTFDYYLLPVYDYEDVNRETHPELFELMREIAAREADFATQNFPVVETRARGPYMLHIGEAAWEEIQTMEDLMTYFHDRIAPHTSADVLLGFVPLLQGRKGFSRYLMAAVERTLRLTLEGSGGQFHSLGHGLRAPAMVHLTLVERAADLAVVVHEFGHAYGLAHLPPAASVAQRSRVCGTPWARQPASAKRVEGFRIAPDGQSGWNKSFREGNQEAASLFPLMFPCMGDKSATRTDRENVFIRNRQYTRLMRGFAQKLGAGLRPHSEYPGTFSLDYAALHGSRVHGPRVHGPGPSTDVQQTALHGVFPDEDVRAAPPTFEAPVFEAPTPGQTVSGALTVRWSAGEGATPEALTYTLLYSPTGEAPWSVRGVDLRRTELEVRAVEFPPGPTPTFRLVASNGDAEQEATVSFALERELPLTGHWPYTHDTVDVHSAVVTTLGTDVDPPAPDALRLRDADCDWVEGAMTYDAKRRRLTFIPEVPLEEGMLYEAVLAPGLEGRYGSRLSEEYTWPFRTQAEGGRADESSRIGNEYAELEQPGENRVGCE